MPLAISVPALTSASSTVTALSAVQPTCTYIEAVNFSKVTEATSSALSGAVPCPPLLNVASKSPPTGGVEDEKVLIWIPQTNNVLVVLVKVIVAFFETLAGISNSTQSQVAVFVNAYIFPNAVSPILISANSSVVLFF